MLKLVETSDAVEVSYSEIRKCLLLIGKCSNLKDACGIAHEYFQHLDHNLVSVIFCSHDDSVPAIRPFRDLPQPLIELAPKMQALGGCPPKKEAQRLLQPFDWKTIDKSRHPDFVSQRFLAEVQKLPYGAVFAVPVVVGGGIAVFTVGIHEHRMGAQSRAEVVAAVCQIATAMISRFPELSTLFEPKTLSTLQASVLLFAIQGFSITETADSLGLSEIAVGLVIDSAQKRLGAANFAQTVARALAYGEFAHMQIGDHELI